MHLSKFALLNCQCRSKKIIFLSSHINIVLLLVDFKFNFKFIPHSSLPQYLRLVPSESINDLNYLPRPTRAIVNHCGCKNTRQHQRPSTTTQRNDRRNPLILAFFSHKFPVLDTLSTYEYTDNFSKISY